jgi:hypothetical protein
VTQGAILQHMTTFNHIKSSQVKSSQWQVQVPPCSAALGTLAHPAR